MPLELVDELPGCRERAPRGPPVGAGPRVPLEKKLTCAKAAANGHLAIVQWARAEGCFWDEETCEEAASNGHLAVLQWARAQGCPWNEKTCAGAAANGHLAVLEWARAEGCPG